MKNITLFLLILFGFISTSIADDWPKRPIKLTVGYGAGGTTDSTARLLAKILEEELDNTVKVINKPGGGGSVAAGLSKTQKPDGYNIFTFTTGAAVLTPHMQDVPYDTLNDFTYIAQFAIWNAGMVIPTDAPYTTFEELIAFAKENPGEISYGISGTGTPQHLTMERIADIEGINWKAVPFKGGAAAVTALLGGHVDVVAGAAEWMPQVKSGEFKLIAIITDKRMAAFQEVPTLMELGYDIAAPSIYGIAGPAGIPEEAVSKLDAAIKKATEHPDVLELVEKLAMQVKYRNSEEFKEHVMQEYEIQGEVLKSIGLSKAE